MNWVEMLAVTWNNGNGYLTGRRSAAHASVGIVGGNGKHRPRVTVRPSPDSLR
ncbi:MAG: hypothetical protein HYY02_09735 [Chloroflexi bacterium]|nr:hypothetical protein [Chloroflexota bacterium]